MMYRFAVFAVTAALCAPAATAQEPDDWDYGEDASRRLSAAVVAFEGGRSIAVQCQDGYLTVALLGLPAHESGYRRLEAERDDGRRSVQHWSTNPADTTILSRTPARAARFMRGAGALTLRAAAGTGAPMRLEWSLPSQSGNLDRVLTACDLPLDDERDRLPLLDDLVQGDDWIEPIMRAVGQRTMHLNARAAKAEISCIVSDDLTLSACRTEQNAPARSNFGSALRRAAEGKRVAVSDADAARDRVFYMDMDVTQEVTFERAN